MYTSRSNGSTGNRARALALVRAYEANPRNTEGSRIGPPGPSALAMLKVIDLLTTGGAGQMVADRLHGKKVDPVAAAAIFSTRGGEGFPRIHPTEQTGFIRAAQAAARDLGVKGRAPLTSTQKRAQLAAAIRASIERP